MEFVKLILSPYGSYSYRGASNAEMGILGCFLSTDAEYDWPLFKEWALADKKDPNSKFTYSTGANRTYLEELEDGYMYLTDKDSEENGPMGLKISREQFVQLLDEWREKVCEKKSKKVIIKHENNQFIIETTD